MENTNALTTAAKLAVEKLQSDIDRIAALDRAREPKLLPEEQAELKANEAWLKENNPTLAACNALLEKSRARLKELELNGAALYFAGENPVTLANEKSGLESLVEFLELASRINSRKKGTILGQIDHLKAMAREREIGEQNAA